MKEFNLSEKIAYYGKVGHFIPEEDVKEFIQRLKEYMVNQNTKDFIDKLAGDDLIKVKGGKQDENNK